MKTDWPRLAEKLAARIPRDALHPAVLAWVEAEDEARDPRTPPTPQPAHAWAVAFSGGADSLALLLLLRAYTQGSVAKALQDFSAPGTPSVEWATGQRLIALHFNHRLRGRAADADEEFCRRVCEGLGVTFRSARWRPPAKPVGEAAARAARLAFFAREQSRLHAPALWLGHQQDDIAESILMRLARGSGAAGLAAPRPVQPMPGGRVHLRPLLTLRKAELAAALRAIRAPWREDATNAGGDFFRNRIRRAVLPAWRRAAMGREALAGAALARERLEEDDAALESWAEEIYPHSNAGLDDARPTPRRGRGQTAPPPLQVAALAGVPPAVARRVLHRWLLAQADTGDLSRQGFDQLLAALRRGTATRFSLGRRGFAVIRRGWLEFEPALVKAKRRRS